MSPLFKNINIWVLLKQFIIILWQFYTHIIRKKFISTEECKMDMWIDAFELWCWRRLLRVPWTARRSNQSILMEINPGISLEGMMLKLKLQYFGHLMRKVDSLEKTLILGGIRGRRRRGRLRLRWLNGITDSMTWVWVNSGNWWRTGRPAVLWSWGRKESDTTERLNWTELNWR